MKTTAVLIICMCAWLTSCSNSRYIDIQVLNPASIKLPSEINNLYIVDYQKTAGQSDPAGNKTRYSKLHYFNQLTNGFNLNLKKDLEESPLFQHTDIKVKKLKEIMEETKNLSHTAQEKQIMISSNFGLLIDTSHIHDYFAYLVFSRFKTNISNIGTHAIMDSHQLYDTLIWDIQKIAELQELPKEAFREIGKMAAQKYSRRIAPYWTTEERQLFFSANSLMREGYNKFIINDYEGAKATWERVYETGTRNLAAKSSFNIALVCELLDDLDNCEEWLQKSLQSKQYIETVNYLKVIQKRKTERLSLESQIK